MRYEFSYPATYMESLHPADGHFRFIDEDGNEQLFKTIAGLAYHVNSDNERGRLFINTELTVTGDHAQLSVGSYGLPIPYNAILLDGGEYWRCCFALKSKQWRALSEADPELLYYTPKFRGVWRMDWYDRSPHVYHVGPIYRLEDDSILMVPSKALVTKRPERVALTIARARIHEARTRELEEMEVVYV